jgi:hypothetical protein
MKVTKLRAIAALALGLVLAACGGKASFDVSGVIQGLTNSGMVLTNGSDTITIPAGATSFSFPTRISYGTDYNMQIKTQPAHMTCNLFNGSGSAGHTTTILATIQCAQNAHNLGGTVTGLVGTDPVGTGLVLANGSTGGTFTVTKPTDGSGRVSFTFPVQVLDGQPFGVTVNTQPAGLVCTVTNGTDVMHETDVGNILVACAPPQ